MSKPDNEKVTTYWVPLSRVKYKSESEAKQASLRMGLLLNKTLSVMKNQDDSSYSIFVLHGKPERIPINHSLPLSPSSL